MLAADWPLENLPGLKAPEYKQLLSLGLKTTQDLLRATGQSSQVLAIAKRLELKPSYVQKWSALANLAQIPSVGCQYAGLILHSGIVSIAQLAEVPPVQLHRRLMRLELGLTRDRTRCPSQAVMHQWRQEAVQILRTEP
ncbi:MAG: DUF4332 domain-containing protein [Cyanobacteria bacterium P01_H01_bin.15]